MSTKIKIRLWMSQTINLANDEIFHNTREGIPKKYSREFKEEKGSIRKEWSGALMESDWPNENSG